MNHILRGATWLLAAALLSSCSGLSDSLTGHARPVADAAGHTLGAEELAAVMAVSPMPDSTLTGHWSGEIARLWADYVTLAAVYAEPDTTDGLEFQRFLEDQRYIDATAVLQYRDSVVLGGVEPDEEELRAYYEDRQPLTRLDVRRIVLQVPSDADGALRDSLRRAGEDVRARIVGGADFLETARDVSHEPPEARGQLLSYQGHADFGPTVDSVLFRLSPGAVSPAIETDEAIYIYRVERRRTPDFESSRDLLFQHLLEERKQERLAGTLDSLLEGARRVIPDGAVETARKIAAERVSDPGRVSGRLRLALWEGGEFTAEELRRLFAVRDDIRQQFRSASDEDIEYYLLELARDEILATAASETGQSPTEEQRAQLARLAARQLAALASRLGISHALVSNPRYDLKGESLAFLQHVLSESVALPWLGPFRVILDQEYGVRVHEGGAETAARKAMELRTARADREHLDEGQPPAADSTPTDRE